ncbi:MAG TPA: hypothetical protein HA263_10165 [Methanoregulaceae archaeon]|nr:hypothetical protein [Methanoregulaceae archaeon]
MTLDDAQQLFGFFFAIYFVLIIERSNDTYGSWDTYSAWSGKTYNINRLVTAWLFLVLLPVTHFAVLFTLLGLFDVTFAPTIAGVANIVLISIGSFFSFGYFRLYEAVLHTFPESFFSDDERQGRALEIRPNFWAHFIPALLYITVSTLLLLVTLYI